jgi:hypothetical protein
MKKFRYSTLEEGIYQGNWHWFLDGVRVTNDYDDVKPLTYILNQLGQDGWQLVSTHIHKQWILMQEY